MNLQEDDFDAPPGDHLGDYRPEHGDPYPATQEAWARTTVTLPGESQRDPAEIRADFARYGLHPGMSGTLVRALAATSWAANGFVLTDGAQGFRLVDSDPQRTQLTIFNHATGAIWLSPTPSRVPGWGSLLIPGRDADGRVHHREMRHTGEVWIFTAPGFVAGTEPIHVQAMSERWG